MARRPIDWSKVGIAVVAVVAVGLIAIGFALANTGDERAVKYTDAAIERVFPAEGELVLRQSQVGVDLAPGYEGVLKIDGVELPVTELVAANPTGGAAPAPVARDAVFDPAQNTVVFTPRDGAAIESLAPGEHAATAVFWRRDQTPAESRSFTWFFTVS